MVRCLLGAALVFTAWGVSDFFQRGSISLIVVDAALAAAFLDLARRLGSSDWEM